MFSENITSLINNNPYLLIENYSKTNPDDFKSDVSKTNAEGLSIFSSFLKNRYSGDFYQKTYELIKKHGYDPKNSYTKYEQLGYRLNKNNPYFIPELMCMILLYANDSTLNSVCKELGKDYIKEMEVKGWPLLELLYQRGHKETIRTVTEFGLNYDITPSGNDILILIENNQEMRNFYWEMKNSINSNNQSNTNQEEYNHFLSYIQKQLTTITTKNDVRTPKIISEICSKIGNLNKNQQTEIIIATLSTKDNSVFKAVCKELKIKPSSLEIQKIILQNYGILQNKDFLAQIIVDIDIWKEKIKIKDLDENLNEVEKEVYGVELLEKALKHFQLTPFRQWASNSSKDKTNKSIKDKILKEINPQVLTSNFDGDNSLFDVISNISKNRKGYIQNTLSGLLNISYNKFNGGKNSFKTISSVDVEGLIGNTISNLQPNQIEEVNDILDKTWRKKGGIQQNLSDTIFKDMLDHQFFIINPIIIKETQIYSNEEKKYLLECAILNLTETRWNVDFFLYDKYKQPIDRNDSFVSKIFKTLYPEFINGNLGEMKLNLTDSSLENLKNSLFISELNALELKDSLSKDLSEQKIPSKKMKI